jgi:hypothetical protein
MTTCEPARSGGETEPPLTLWPEDFLASLSASPGRASRRRIAGGSGQPSMTLFALLIPDSPSSRMFPAFCPQEDLEPNIAAYVAGLADGDGSIWIQPGRTTQLYPKISIRLGWKGRTTLEELHRCFGGYMGEEKRQAHPKHSAVYHWTATGRSAVPVLQHIYPFLRIKKAQAAVALHLASIWESGVSDRYLTGRRLRELMRILNQTGPEIALPVVGRWLLVPELTNSSGKQELRFLKTWPPAGVMVSGTAYRRPSSVPPIYVTESGLWPTPETGLSPNGHGRRGGKPGNGHQSGASLEAMARMWPTPNASDGWLSEMAETISPEARERQLRRGQENGSRRARSGSLAKDVQRWPTPMARDHRTGQPGRVGDPTRHGGWNLNDWAARWPTPVASDAGTDRGSSAGWGLRDAVGGLLNPAWVEWLMGYPEGWTDCGD